MAKQRIIWSPRAKLDLYNILDFYIKRNDSKTYSIKLNLNLRKSVMLIEKYPRIGVQTDVSGIRILIKGDYAIFYEIKAESIEIVSIWDCRQNPESTDIT